MPFVVGTTLIVLLGPMPSHGNGSSRISWIVRVPSNEQGTLGCFHEFMEMFTQMAIGTVLTLFASNWWPIWQLDVSNAKTHLYMDISWRRCFFTNRWASLRNINGLNQIPQDLVHVLHDLYHITRVHCHFSRLLAVCVLTRFCHCVPLSVLILPCPHVS